jgi:hypothetical protein
MLFDCDCFLPLPQLFSLPAATTATTAATTATAATAAATTCLNYFYWPLPSGHNKAMQGQIPKGYYLL